MTRRVRINEETLPNVECGFGEFDVYITVITAREGGHEFGPVLAHILKEGGFQVHFTRARSLITKTQPERKNEHK